MKQLGIASFTEAGGRVADKLAMAFGAEYEIARYEKGLKDWCGGLFAAHAEGILFVGACGIAVRTIAPFLKSKTTDPAVLVIDEKGQFVISLLSGHIGGANRLALRAAEVLGATPVITTATDVNGKFAVDVFASDNHLRIESMALAKKISAAILRGDKVGLYCEGEIEGALPPELVRLGGRDGAGGAEESVSVDAMVWIGVPSRDFRDPDARGAFPILNLVPKAYVLGIGCKKGIPEAAIARAVDLAMTNLRISPEDIAAVASIDRKKEEPGLVEFCRKRNLRFQTFPAETLAKVPGAFTGSSFVQSVTGVDNVCERAALCLAGQLSEEGPATAVPDSGQIACKDAVMNPANEGESDAGNRSAREGNPDADRSSADRREGSFCKKSDVESGRLVLGKQAMDGVTVAVAERKWSVRF